MKFLNEKDYFERNGPFIFKWKIFMKVFKEYLIAEIFVKGNLILYYRIRTCNIKEDPTV